MPRADGEWAALAADPAIANPYFAPAMLGAAMTHLKPGTGESAPELLTLRDARGGLLLLAPVVYGRSFGKLPIPYAEIWQPPHFYNGTPLMAKGRQDEAIDALLGWLDTHPHGARFLRLTGTLRAPFEATIRRRLIVRKARTRAVLSRGARYEDHLTSVYNGKKRKQMRRLANRLADQGEVRFTERAITPALARDYLRMEAAGWKGREEGGEPLVRSDDHAAFFREAMVQAGDAGQAHCLTLDLDGVPIAMLFVLEAGGQRVLYKTSFDEAYGGQSPGVQLLMEATRRMLDESDADTYDSCAKEDHPVMNSLWPEREAFADLHVPAGGPFDGPLLRLGAAIGDLRRRKTAVPGPDGGTA